MLRLLTLSALVAAAFAIPKTYIPRDDTSACPSAVVASSRSAQVGNATVLLEVLTCATGTTPTGLVADISIGQEFENLLCRIIPIFCPPKPFDPPAARPTPTVTVVRTSTVVRTATLVQTATEVVPTTVIDSTTLVVPTTIISPTTVIDETTLVVPTTIIAPTTVIDETTLAVQVPTTIIAPTTVIVTAAAPTSTAAAATNVCGELCAITCSNLGPLPPVSEDCQTVMNSIQVFQGTLGPTFTVPSNHVQQLTFGTCHFFFENLGPTPLEACWSDLSQEGSLASTTCFPPAQPVMSLAVCEARDTTWEIGVSHS
ncbi:unnamed protein product [Peniophora sp. CBMAI 1063]|nr:unnamed protein product [Peniophora sp. CBMAI 1063]